jgi:aspartate/methionine/tyrosine aminotransferase
MTASMADIYEKGISTAGMSKAYSLAGLRLGWITAPDNFIEDVMIHRDYDTISVGMIDDHFATLALENSERLLERSRLITRGNLKTLSDWMATQPKLSWVEPRSGTTALVKFDLDMSSYEFCISLLKQTGVMFTPGSSFDMEGYVRIGYANNPKILQTGLERVSDFLLRH